MNRPEHAFYTINGNGINISLHIQPRASRNEVCGVHDNALKIRLTSPPVDGAANKLCLEFLAGVFGIPKSSITIIAGDASRHKRVCISSNDPAQLALIAEKLAATGT